MANSRKGIVGNGDTRFERMSANTKNDRKYDIVLYGASGFTGRQTVAYCKQFAPSGLRWAIAGRNRSKLESVNSAGADVLVADAQDDALRSQRVWRHRPASSPPRRDRSGSTAPNWLKPACATALTIAISPARRRGSANKSTGITRELLPMARESCRAAASTPFHQTSALGSCRATCATTCSRSA